MRGDPAGRAVRFLGELEARGDIVRGPAGAIGGGPGDARWIYVSVRRMTVFLESSLKAGLQWVVFEPNAEPLWAEIRLDVGSFLQALFVQGAFQGQAPQQAYFVKCDSETNTPATMALGVVNIVVGFAPVLPAEFVVVQISQLAGQPPGDGG